jgi:hypothetical protein
MLSESTVTRLFIFPTRIPSGFFASFGLDDSLLAVDLGLEVLACIVTSEPDEVSPLPGITVPSELD